MGAFKQIPLMPEICDAAEAHLLALTSAGSAPVMSSELSQIDCLHAAMLEHLERII
jgi:hypothetical protein